MLKDEYNQLIKSKNNLPTGVLGKVFSIDFISEFLESNLGFNESLIYITGVRYKGKEAFLILTSGRILCISAFSKAISKKNFANNASQFEVPLDLKHKKIHKLFVAPTSGIIAKDRDIELRIYFVQPKLGENFSRSLQSLGIDIEIFETIHADKYENRLLLQGVCFFLVMIVLFSGCVYKSITNTESPGTDTSPEAIEACLSQYIQGDTVEDYEIEEAYRKCSP